MTRLAWLTTITLTGLALSAAPVTPQGSDAVGFKPERARLKGLGEVPLELLNSGTPVALTAPKPLPVSPPDIDEDLAIRLATARARWQWGDAVRLGSVLPVYGLDGELHAYDVDFTLDGDPFGDYVSVARGWLEDRATRRAQFQALEEAAAGGQPRSPRKTGSERFGSVTVSATHDAPPFRGVRAGVSNFYASGWVAAEVAARALGTTAVTLERAIMNGSWERLYAFTDGVTSIVVQGHEPWGWYDAAELSEVSAQGRVQVLERVRSMATAAGQAFEDIRTSAREDHKATVDQWLSGTLAPAAATFIPGYDTDFTPYYWHGGCSPTSGSMVLNYYDEHGAYGKMTYTYSDAYCPVLGDLQCHVSNMIPRMIDWMGTDGAGGTYENDIYPGMLGYANTERGYAFSGGIDRENGPILGWHCDEAQDMIDNGHPFVWSLDYYPGGDGGGHSVAVVGYDTGPDEFACYNTWDTGGVIEWAPCEGGALDDSDYAAPVPGGGSEYNVKLISPDGLQTYDDCGPWGYVQGGTTATILWDNGGRPAHHVALHYSLDAGQTWTSIHDDVEDGGICSWTPPCDVETDHARVRVIQYSSGGDILSADGSYGDFSIHRPQIPNSPILLDPWDLATCVATEATLDWSDEYAANGYELQVGTSCGSGTVYTPVLSQKTVTLDPNTTYYWRVRAFNGCGVYGDWTACRQFTTQPQHPSAPDLQVPDDGATCVSSPVTLNWSNIAGAVQYRLQVGTSCGTGFIYYVTASDTTLASLDPRTVYYWRVRAVRDCDVLGEWSACRSFETAPDIPPEPTLLSPEDGATCIGAPVTLDWEGVPGAVNYRVRVGTTCGEGSIIDSPVSELTLASLDPTTRYYWQVKAVRDCGAVGLWGGCFHFDTSPLTIAAPDPVYPLPGATCIGQDVVLDWVDVVGAATYDVELGTACGSGTLYTGCTSSSLSVTDLDLGATYFWRVRGVGCGVTGKWIDCVSFTIRPPGLPANDDGRWALHFAGPHDIANTCESLDIWGCGSIAVNGPAAAGRYDVYVLAVNVGVLTSTRFGLACTGSVVFNGWTPCGWTPGGNPTEDMTAAWPGCNEADRLSWSGPRCGHFQVVGVLDVTVEAGATLSITVDPRVGYAELCDDASPTPVCVQTTDPSRFGRVGFGVPGYNTCSPLATEPAEVAVARNFLGMNAPNPVSRVSGTTIHYELAETAPVVIEIVDASGRLVRRMEQQAVAGANRLTWDCRNGGGRLVAGGIYFYQLRAPGFRSARKLLVVD